MTFRRAVWVDTGQVQFWGAVMRQRAGKGGKFEARNLVGRRA
jgi:hypothetical protein